MPRDDVPFRPAPARRAFEEIADQIRESIYSKKLRPGDKLPPERELAEKLRAGRTAVREALRVLEQSGLIAVKQGSEGGSFVKDVDASTISGSIADVIRRSHVSRAHLTEVRIGVERLIIGVAMARITVEEIDLLKEHLDKAAAMAKALELEPNRATFELWARENFQFHLVLAEATRNPLFVMILESLMNVVHTFLIDLQLVPEFLHAHVDDHRGIYEAVLNKDLRLAERRIEQHNLNLERTLSYRAVANDSQQESVNEPADNREDRTVTKKQ